MKNVLKITALVLIILIVMFAFTAILLNIQQGDKRLKPINQIFRKYNKYFSTDCDIDNDEYLGKIFRCTIHIKKDTLAFDKETIIQCNKLKCDLEKYLQEHPDSFLVQEEYKINLCFTHNKEFNGIDICNYYSKNSYPTEKLCVIGLTNNHDYQLFKYFDNIELIKDNNCSSKDIKYLKEMPSLKKIYMNKILKEDIEIFKKELPDCEIIYKKVIE